MIRLGIFNTKTSVWCNGPIKTENDVWKRTKKFSKHKIRCNSRNHWKSTNFI